MAAVGTVTLKTDQYESMLEKIKQKTESASNSMSQSVGKVGSQVSKAGGVLKTLGASIGSHFGALGSVISSVTAGPIAMFTAAIGSLVAIGTQIWDKMTMSASEYAAELERISKEAEKAHQSMLKQMDEDSGYMDRLAELAKKENLSNEAKAEAAALIQMLTSRYGDLGISIDAVTGQIVGMDEAQERFLKKQKEMKSASLQRQIETSERSTVSKALVATSGMAIGEETLQKFGISFRSMDQARHQVRGFFTSRSDADQLKFAEYMRDTVAKTKEDKSNWQAVVDEILKRMDNRAQKALVDDTSYETEAKAAAAARKKTQEAEDKAAKEKREDDEVQRIYDQRKAYDRALEEKKQRGLNAESDYQFAHAASDDEKIANREARIRAEEEHIKALEEAKKKVDIFEVGMEKADKMLHEYDMAIEEAKQRIIGFRHQIEEVKAAPKKEEEEPARRPEPKAMAEGFKTDSLTARGALLGGGVRSEDAQRTEQVKKVASSAEAIRRIMEHIEQELKIE